MLRQIVAVLRWQQHYEAQQDVMNYITMWYNSNRLHSYLGYKSPNDFELKINELEKVAYLG